MVQATLEPRIVFSVLFAESADYLPLVINNFLQFAPQNSHLMVSVGHSFDIHRLPSYSDRITVFVGESSRKKWGHTLLDGHLEAFLKAERMLGRSDFFCTMASNGLFFREIDLHAIRSEMARDKKIQFVGIDDLPDKWQWPSVKKVEKIGAALRNAGVRNLCWNQIEGLISTWSNWQKVAAMRADLAAAGGAIDVGLNISFEEMIPVSVFCGLGNGQFANICKNFWERYNSGGDGSVTFVDLLDEHPDHIAALKWFNRSAHSVETAVVATRAGGHVLSAVRTAGAGEMLAIVGAMRSAADYMLDTLSFGPAMEEGEGAPLMEPGGAACSTSGEYEKFAVGVKTTDLEWSSAYLFSEPTGYPSAIKVEFANGILQYQCETKDADLNRVQAYVYIYMGRLASVGRIARLTSADNRKILFAVGPQHVGVNQPAVRVNGFDYYSAPSGGNRAHVYIGVPITSGQGSVSLEFSAPLTGAVQPEGNWSSFVRLARASLAIGDVPGAIGKINEINLRAINQVGKQAAARSVASLLCELPKFENGWALRLIDPSVIKWAVNQDNGEGQPSMAVAMDRLAEAEPMKHASYALIIRDALSLYSWDGALTAAEAMTVK
jgi:hypothetical protein